MTMPAGRMHADEVETDPALVRRLLAGQFPRWAGLPIARVPSSGTDNAIYRLGTDLAVRMPRIAWATGQIEKDQRWLPRLAPHLPVAIHAPLAVGEPAEGYPWQWAVYPWIEGRNPAPDDAGLDRVADDLAQFLLALQRIDASDGPPAGSSNFNRGVPLAMRDAGVRTALAALAGQVDVPAVTSLWEAALALSKWDGPGVWLHGDLTGGNLLVRDGRLAAVIDFGCLGVGDPAADLTTAWNLFSGEVRQAYRAALAVDDATWARGRAWALSAALGAIPYYRHTNPPMVAAAWRTLTEVLSDRQ